MRVLVTGGLGYIGSHTCIDLLEKGHVIAVIDNLVNSTLKVLTGIENISGKKIKFYQVDIVNHKELIKVFHDFKPESVVHFAGLKSVSDSISIPLDYYETNVVGTVNILRAMNLVNCKNIIFSSSAVVYGQPKYSPCDENHPTNPVNPYGRTKLIAEKLIQDWIKITKNSKALIFRYFNPVGAHSSGVIGESPTGNANNIMPVILQVATGEKDSLVIFGDDYDTRDGTGVRDYIHVADLSMAHAIGIESLNNLDNFTILNLGTGRNYSIFELIKVFEESTGIKIKNEISSRRKGDLAEVWASNKKAKKILGINLDKSLEVMCEDALRFKKNNN